MQNTRIKSVGVVIALICAGLFALIAPLGMAVQDYPVNYAHTLAIDSHTWDGGGANALASTKENWATDIAPTAGDAIVYDAGSSASTFDLALSLGSFTITAGYSGTITIGASYTVTSYAQAGGVYTGSETYTMSVSTTFAVSGGTWTPNKGIIIFSTDGASASGNDISPYGIIVNGNTTFTEKFTLSNNLAIASGKVLTVTGVQLGLKTYNGGALTNSGAIVGTGQLAIYNYGSGSVVSMSFGLTDIGVWITEWSPNGHTTVRTNSDSVFLGSVAVDSNGDPVNTVTLDLSTTNYNLSTASMTIGAGGILLGRGSTITVSGNWDSSAGTFTAGTSTLVMSGTTKTIKTANTNGAPYDLQISGAITTLSSLNVTNDLTIDSGKSLTLGSGKTLGVTNEIINNGAIHQAGNVIEIAGPSATPLKGYGTFDGNLYLNVSPVNLDVQTSLSTGYLHFTKIVNITTSLNGCYLIVTPSTGQTVNLTGLTLGDSASWTVTSTGQVDFTVSGLMSGIWYDLIIDGNQQWTKKVIQGTISFNYPGPWSPHTFELTENPQVSPVIYVTLLMLVIGILIGIIGVVVHLAKNPREQLTIKELIKLILYILIGVSMLGAIYSIAI